MVKLLVSDSGNGEKYLKDFNFNTIVQIINNMKKQIQKYTINTGQVPSTLTDSTLLINGTYPSLIDAINLEFKDTDNVHLESHIKKFNKDTGELVVMVDMPIIKDGTTIRLNSTVPST